MSMDLKTWERINQLYECLLPGNNTRVIYLDFGDEKKETKGTLNYSHITGESRREENADNNKIYEIGVRALEDSREQWGYM